MIRTLLTFSLLTLILFSSLYLLGFKFNKTMYKNYKDYKNVNVNLEIEKNDNKNRKEIEKYRLGIPLSQYNNPNTPYSNNYRLHPKSFIPQYRQPIDGIVPDHYDSNLEKENLMYAQLDCLEEKENCMDKTKDYYSDLLN